MSQNKKWWENPLYNFLYRMFTIVIAAVMIYICQLITGSATSECVVIAVATAVALNGFIPGVTEGSG